MLKGRAFSFSVFLALLLIPPTVSADYLYPGTAGFQPLAVIEPVTPDSLFYSWTGEVDRGGKTNLGVSIDFLRNTDNSDDWDLIFSATGAFRSGERLLYGITVPYIIRDPEFNESDLLDLRAFARMVLLRGASGFNVSGELSAIFPSASQGATYPFTLDSPVAGARFALSGRARDMRLGANIGYQKYLQSETGQDSDLLYSLWVERPLQGPWNLAVEYTGSTHTHSGAPGDDKVSDAYISVGVNREQSEKMALGLAAAAGVGGETPADLRVKASLTVKLGTVEKKKVEKRAKKKIDRKKRKPRKTGSDATTSKVIAIMIAE